VSGTLIELTPLEQLFASFAAAELPKNAHSNGLENRRTALSGAGYLVAVYIANTNTSAQYIQIHDTNAAPASGAVPEVLITAGASGDKFVPYSLPGRYFRHGITIANSSTAGTYTAGSADCFFDVQFIPIVGPSDSDG